MKRTLLLIAVLAMLTLTAAECSFSTANIANAYMAADPDGNSPFIGLKRDRLAQMAEADAHVTVGDPPEALLEVLREVAPTTT